MLETVGKHMQNKTKPIFMSSLQGQTRLYEKRLKDYKSKNSFF